MSLWDAVSLILGIVVGSSIYRVPGLVFSNVTSPLWGLGFWLLGGALSFLGVLIYAELATTYPRLGGEYNYLTKAFGPWLGFLFAWSQLAVIQTASIGALAFVFADYACEFWAWPTTATPWLAAAAVVALTVSNMLGLKAGTRLQNVLTLVKLVGLGALIVAGLGWGTADPWTPAPNVDPTTLAPSLALVMILYAYGGWSDAGFVAAEVRDLSRNVPRALLLGLSLITLLYLLINYAYLAALGGAGVAGSAKPAADTLQVTWGPRAANLMSLLVMASALGGVNGLIFSASRIHARLGEDYRLLGWLRGFSRAEAPLASLAAQGLVVVGMIITVGTATGQTGVNRLVVACGFAAIDWARFDGGFGTLVSGSAPAFWSFFVLTATAFIVLRFRDPDRPRPFRVPGGLLSPLIFLATCGWMLHASATYAWDLLPVMCVPLLWGLPAYALCRWYEGLARRGTTEDPE